MARDYKVTVKALLAKAAGLPKDSPEQILCQEQAFALMSKHQISVALDSGNSDERVHKILTFSSPYVNQKRILYTQIAKNFNLSTIESKGQLHVFGFRSDFDQTEFLYSILYNQFMESLAKLTIPPHIHAKRYRTSYWLGFTVKIKERLDSAKKTAREEAGTGAAVVLVTRQQRADNERRKVFPHIKTKSSSYARSGDAFSRGQELGENARFHDGSGINNSSRELGPPS